MIVGPYRAKAVQKLMYGIGYFKFRFHVKWRFFKGASVEAGVLCAGGLHRTGPIQAGL